MKSIRFALALLSLTAIAGPLAAQADPADLGRLDEGIAVLEATQKQVMGELTSLEKALNDPEAVVWPTGEGWAWASTGQLEREVAFLQLAASRPEGKDRTDRVAGLALPASLAEAAIDSPNRPARRVVREWADSHGAEHQKAIATHHQNLKRTAKMTESWLAEHRAQRAAVTQPVAQSAAYPQGPCYVPPGKWAMGSTREVLEITVNDYFVTATKTRGSRQVPAGKINFYVHPRTCDAGLQNAEDGFVNPYWVRARIQIKWIQPGSQFSIDWPDRQEIVYTKAE